MKLKRVLAWGLVAIPVFVVVAVSIAYWTSDNACGTGNTAGPAASPAHPMQAWVYCDYGAANVLTLTTVEKPAPTDSEILVKVHAASVNPLDWHFMRGKPYVMRMQSGLRRPTVLRLGVDFAGTVEAVGKRVTQFKPGDEVFGGKTGAFAEYVAMRADGAVALKPTNMTFEQAATVAIAATTALQGLRDGGKLRAGQTVLINGASGGVGTFAVQIAKSYGALVTGVCSTRNVDMVRALGADSVVDYTKGDYTTRAQRYDLILDNVGNRTVSDNRRALNPQGHFVLIGGGGPDAGDWIGPFVGPAKAMIMSRFVSQEMGMLLASLNQADMIILRDLMQSGRVTPVIDKRFPLTEVPAAITYLEAGRARGKVVITLE